MSVHSAVKGALNKLTDKGDENIEGHSVEAMDDGTYVHSVRFKRKEKRELGSVGREERHTHPTMKHVTQCMKSMHDEASGIVEK